MTQRSESRSRTGFGNRALGLLPLLVAIPLAAQEGAKSPEHAQPENLLLKWAGWILVLVVIWFILYKVVYPYFLRYYDDRFCKTIFWSLFLLYFVTWLFLSCYFIVDWGFYHDWMQWAAVFLGILWLISLVVLLLRSKTA